jgi:hypothetical protein
MPDQEYLRAEIYRNLDLRETEDLIDVWQEHDTSAYTDMAFDVIIEILLKRLGSLPPQEDNAENKSTDHQGFGSMEFPDWNKDEDREGNLTQTCPNCKSSNVFPGGIVDLSTESKIVIKSRPPEGNSDGEMTAAYNELVAFACEDCGHVFFILKDFT